MTMLDSVNPVNIPLTANAVLGYDDGPKSKWPTEGWTRFANKPCLHCSTTGETLSEVQDVESGNMSPMMAATNCLRRFQQKQWTIIYCSELYYNRCSTALSAKSLRFLDASQFPAPGVYLGAADWTNMPHDTVSWAKVRPLFTQYERGNDYDTSTLYPGFLSDPAVPPVLPTDIASKVKDETVIGFSLPNGQYVIAGNATDNGNLLVITCDNGNFSVEDVTAKIHFEVPADPRTYKIV